MISKLLESRQRRGWVAVSHDVNISITIKAVVGRVDQLFTTLID
jgi:hypothetical protein